MIGYGPDNETSEKRGRGYADAIAEIRCRRQRSPPVVILTCGLALPGAECAP
jgi:hypothetical protein